MSTLGAEKKQKQMEELKTLCDEIEKCNPNQVDEAYYNVVTNCLRVECPERGMFDHLLYPYNGEHFEFTWVKYSYVTRIGNERRRELTVQLHPKSTAAKDECYALGSFMKLVIANADQPMAISGSILFYPQTMKLCIRSYRALNIPNLSPLPPTIGPFCIIHHCTSSEEGLLTAQLARNHVDVPPPLTGHEVKEVEKLQCEIQRLKEQRCNRIVKEYPILWVVERKPDTTNQWPERMFGPFFSRSQAENSFDAKGNAKYRVGPIATSSLTDEEIWNLGFD